MAFPSLEGVFKEGWQLVNGSKLPYLGALLLMFVTLIIFNMIFAALGGAFTQNSLVLAALFGFIGALGSWALQLFFQTNIFMMGIKRAQGATLYPTMIFENRDKIVPLVIGQLIMAIAIVIGFLLLVLPGIYLMVALLFTGPLIVDRGLKPIEALDMSRRIITPNWFSYFIFILAGMIVVGLSVIPLGIPLFWTIPWFNNCIGILYRQAMSELPQTASATA